MVSARSRCRVSPLIGPSALALWTSRSRRPSTAASRASRWSASVTSPGIAVIRSAAGRSRRVSSRAASRPSVTTCQPWSLRAATSARPSPALPPVMSAVFVSCHPWWNLSELEVKAKTPMNLSHFVARARPTEHDGGMTRRRRTTITLGAAVLVFIGCSEPATPHPVVAPVSPSTSAATVPAGPAIRVPLFAEPGAGAARSRGVELAPRRDGLLGRRRERRRHHRHRPGPATGRSGEAVDVRRARGPVGDHRPGRLPGGGRSDGVDVDRGGRRTTTAVSSGRPWPSSTPTRTGTSRRAITSRATCTTGVRRSRTARSAGSGSMSRAAGWTPATSSSSPSRPATRR